MPLASISHEMDTPPLTPSWQRWYFGVALLFWGLAMCAMVAAMASAMLLQPGRALLFTGIAGGLMGVMVIWQAWVFPWFRANDGPSDVAESPRHELRDLRFVIWLPIFSLAAVGVLILVGEPVLRYHLRGDWQWSDTASLGCLLLATLVPATGWACWLSRCVGRRFRQRTADLHRCFDCGYDLHASPSPTCPECGCQRLAPSPLAMPAPDASP